MSNAHMIDPSYQTYCQALSEGFPLPTYSGPTHVASAATATAAAAAPAPVATSAVVVSAAPSATAPAAPECNFGYHGGVHYWNPS